jgi:hypothetical protein
MSGPITAGRVHAAAGEVRARCLILRLNVAAPGGPDLADAVADLLHHQAGAIEVLEAAGRRVFIPGLRALVEAVEGAL